MKHAWVWILGVGAISSQASELSPEDFAIYHRNACLAERTKAAGGPGGFNQQACYQLTTAEKDFVTGMGKQFCEKPEDFCAKYRGMVTDERDARKKYKKAFDMDLDHLSGKGDIKDSVFDRTRSLVGPRCEPGIQPSTGYHSSTNLGFVFRTRMLTQWGCDKPGYTKPDAQHFSYQVSCDPAKLPFGCGTRVLKDPSLQSKGKVAAINAQIKELAPKLAGGKCVLSMGALDMATDAYVPLACDSNEPPGGDCDKIARDGLEQGLDRLGESLYGEGSKRFRESSLMIFKEQVVDSKGNTVTGAQLMQDKFDAAKKGVLAYLEKIKAPEDIKELIRQTEFNSPVDLIKTPANAAEGAAQAKKWDDLEKDCRHEGTAGIGYSNGFNSETHTLESGFPAKASIHHKITLCPNELLDAERGNPKELLQVFAHELGHSIDPCALGGRAHPAARVGTCSAEASPPLKDAASFQAFRDSEADFRFCLLKHSLMERKGQNWNVPEVRPIKAADFWKKVMDAKPGVLTSQEKCDAAAFQDPKQLLYCPGNYPSKDILKRLPMSADAKKQLLEDWDRSQGEQSREAWGDQISAEAFPLAAEEDDPAWKTSFDRNQKLADVLTSVAWQCGPPDSSNTGWVCVAKGSNPCDSKYPEPDNHPADIYRMSILAGATNLREAVCDPAKLPMSQMGNGSQMPSGGCQLKAAPGPSGPWFKDANPYDPEDI